MHRRSSSSCPPLVLGGIIDGTHLDRRRARRALPGALSSPKASAGSDLLVLTVCTRTGEILALVAEAAEERRRRWEAHWRWRRTTTGT